MNARERGDRAKALSLFETIAKFHPDRLDGRLGIAEECRALGRLDESESIYQDVLIENPDHIGALHGLAMNARGRGDRAKALSLFETIAKCHPDRPEGWLGIAEEYRELGRLDESESIYQDILNNTSNHIGALRGLAMNARRRGDRAKALSLFESISKLYPDRLEGRLGIAEEYRELGRLDESDSIYWDILNDNPNYIGALRGLTMNARRRGDRAKALSLFETIAKLHPDRLEGQLGIAEEYRALGRLDKSDSIYRDILKNNPNHIGVLRGLAMNARGQGDRAKALSLFKSITKLYPDRLEGRLGIAEEYRELGRLDESDNIYRDILKNNPNHIGALRGLAMNTRGRGDRAKALSQFEKISELIASRPQVWLDIATELHALGRYSEAIETLKEKEDDFSAIASMYLKMGCIHRERCSHEEALQCFETASQIEPFNLQAMFHVAVEKITLGDVHAAIDEFKRILSQDPSHLRTLIKLGGLAINLRLPEKAMSYFQRAIDAHPHQIEPYLQLAHVHFISGKIEKSMEVLDRATALLGNRPELYLRKVSFLWRNRQFESALALTTEGTALFPDHYGLQKQYILWLIELGQYKKAAHRIAFLSQDTPQKRQDAILLLAQIDHEQWRFPRAKLQYEAILASNSNCHAAHGGLRRIALATMDMESAVYHGRELDRIDIGIQKLKGQLRLNKHNIFGMLVDEYRLQWNSLQRVQAALKLQGDRRLKAIVKVILDEPDATCAAVSLITQLRVLGYFDIQVYGGSHRIPRKIFQYWDKPHPPEDVLRFAKSWKIHNPDYDYQLFDERAARIFLKEHYPANYFKVYLGLKPGAQKADFLRLALLYKYGGIYADIDDMCLKPLDDFIPSDTKLMLWQEPMMSVGNNFIVAVPEHPVIEYALHRAVEAMERGDHETIWLSTGPGLLSRSLAVYFAQNWGDSYPDYLQVKVVPKARLMNHVGIHGFLRYKSTNDSWVIREFSAAKGSFVDL
ncbi:tetratricopeptide repeat protein [Desulfovibrio inopinatus]|uniref:tetratricopeptide repeat protein n=1 Tax=Desulfovibrio inopinatus TaxID=102109 RepID=UPI0004274EA1|nr:tetratricopeptide repeat protein [Desulfovibrio inopinatus]